MLMVRAQGALVPDEKAQAAAAALGQKAKDAQKCPAGAGKLETEVGLFKESAKVGNLFAPKPTPPAPLRPGQRPVEQPKGPDADVVFAPAQTVQKLAKAIAECRAQAGALDAEAEKAMVAVETAAKVVQKEATNDDKVAFAQDMHKLVDAPLAKLTEAMKASATAEKAAADAQIAKADGMKIREALPKGVLPRNTAVGLAAGLGLLTLIISLLSLRFASARRLTTLAPLRDAARRGQSGAQAVTLVRVAGERNGGEPGLVMGSGVFALGAAMLVANDADLFVASTMGGCLIGMGLQYLFRSLRAGSAFRDRILELAEIEKPALSMVLVLEGVEKGKEDEFVQYMNGLPAEEAAKAVEKLATHAEERILAQADARAGA
jgi:hypothetical protein